MSCVLAAKYCNKTSTAKSNLINHGIIERLVGILKDCLNATTSGHRVTEKDDQDCSSLQVRLVESNPVNTVLLLLKFFALGPLRRASASVKQLAKILLELCDWRNVHIFPVVNRAKAKAEDLLVGKDFMTVVEDIELETKQKYLTKYLGIDLPDTTEAISGKVLSDLDHMTSDSDFIGELKREAQVIESQCQSLTCNKVELVRIVIKTVVGPCQYWAWIRAEETRAKVDAIQKSLLKLLTQDRLCLSLPHVGEMIIVGRSDIGPYRARVLQSSNEAVRVFAVDYGFIRELETK
jgi:hypothetical protein